MIHSQAMRLAALLVGGALLAGSSAALAQDTVVQDKAPAEDKVLAKVNGHDIKESDLKYAEAEVGPQLAEMPVDKRKRLLLEFVIEMRLFADAADEAKLTSGPDYEKRLAYWAQRAKRDAFYESAIKGSIGDGVAKGIYEDKVKMIPPEDEVDARHILVETEEKAKEVVDKIGKGEDFSKLATEYSIDAGSKAQSGKLGYFSKGQMVKEFEEAAFALKKGEVSKPVKSQFGWHIILVDDRRTKPLPSYEDVKGHIVDSMVQQKGQQISQDLRTKAKLEYLDAEIAEQVKQETAVAAAKKKMFEQQMEEQIKGMEKKEAAPEKK